MPRTKPASFRTDKYERYTVSASFGAGPLRNRAILIQSYGKCASCGLLEELHGGKCDFCRWMENDREANEKWD